LMEPRKVWAFAATASENAIRTAMTRRFIDSISPLFEIKNLNSAPSSASASQKTRKDKLRPLRRPD